MRILIWQKMMRISTMIVIIQIQQMRYCLLVFTQKLMFLMKRWIRMRLRRYFLTIMDIQLFRCWEDLQFVISMQKKHRRSDISRQNSMTVEGMWYKVPIPLLMKIIVWCVRQATIMYLCWKQQTRKEMCCRNLKKCWILILKQRQRRLPERHWIRIYYP